MKTVQDDVDKLKQKNGEKTVEVLDEKEKIEKAFEAKVIGHPAGNFETKQKQYLEMLNKGKIKQPKDQTLEFYKIAKDKEGKFYSWPENEWLSKYQKPMEIHRFKHLIPQQKNNDNNDNNNNNVTTNKPVREDGQDLGVMRHCCLELVLLAWVKSLCCWCL